MTKGTCDLYLLYVPFRAFDQSVLLFDELRGGKQEGCCMAGDRAVGRVLARH